MNTNTNIISVYDCIDPITEWADIKIFKRTKRPAFSYTIHEIFQDPIFLLIRFTITMDLWQPFLRCHSDTRKHIHPIYTTQLSQSSMGDRYTCIPINHYMHTSHMCELGWVGGRIIFLYDFLCCYDNATSVASDTRIIKLAGICKAYSAIGVFMSRISYS